MGHVERRSFMVRFVAMWVGSGACVVGLIGIVRVVV